MIWALFLSAAIGALCGIWLHVVVFAILASLIAAVFLATTAMSGLAILSALFWSLMLSTSLALGYMASHLLRYAIHMRAKAAKPVRPDMEAAPEYVRDRQRP
ncbi:hypothetical protein [Neorhizobium sp. NCHU2750]|uniref:hypothetical protein n=1 Tax=Neorhizobium sp. NCHU2750 TaxID=1825976 RepID=UPI000EB78EDD|nr:hypothetical protein NCHU2750_05700 [Neorhizobium sp. NCHU2750]